MNLNEQPREPMDTQPVTVIKGGFPEGLRITRVAYAHTRYVFERSYEYWCAEDGSQEGGWCTMQETVETIIIHPVMKCWGRGIGLKGAKRG